MKNSFAVITLGLLVLGLVACTPNRLTQSLPSPPLTEQPQPTATNTIEPPPVDAPLPSGRTLQPQLAAAQIDPDEVVTLLPPDAIRAISPGEVAGILISAADADAAGMSPGTRVLGVSINGDSRAYPIPYLSSHEIVNDEVGGQLIAATW
jgi:hypothetical protein